MHTAPTGAPDGLWTGPEGSHSRKPRPALPRALWRGLAVALVIEAAFIAFAAWVAFR